MTNRLVAGDSVAEIDTGAGGRLASLVVGGRERLLTREDPAAVLPAISWGSFVMVPWVGRMRDGQLRWRGRTAELPVNFRGHAIHGVAFDQRWIVAAESDASVTLECRLGPSGRWPFDAVARQTITLLPDALDQQVEVRAAEPMPVAAGWHPWFLRREGEPMHVTVPSPSVLETTEGPIPTGATIAVAGDTDLRGGPELGDRRLDHAYVKVDGPCVVEWADLRLVIQAAPLCSVVVHSPASAVCVEPQTAWPDAIRLSGEGIDVGLASIGPGEIFVARTRWSWSSPVDCR